jgi:hypothetical protein
MKEVDVMAAAHSVGLEVNNEEFNAKTVSAKLSSVLGILVFLLQTTSCFGLNNHKLHHLNLRSLSAPERNDLVKCMCPHPKRQRYSDTD